MDQQDFNLISNTMPSQAEPSISGKRYAVFLSFLILFAVDSLYFVDESAKVGLGPMGGLVFIAFQLYVFLPLTVLGGIVLACLPVSGRMKWFGLFTVLLLASLLQLFLVPTVLESDWSVWKTDVEHSYGQPLDELGIPLILWSSVLSPVMLVGWGLTVLLLPLSFILGLLLFRIFIRRISWRLFSIRTVRLILFSITIGAAALSFILFLFIVYRHWHDFSSIENRLQRCGRFHTTTAYFCFTATSEDYTEQFTPAHCDTVLSQGRSECYIALAVKRNDISICPVSDLGCFEKAIRRLGHPEEICTTGATRDIRLSCFHEFFRATLVSSSEDRTDVCVILSPARR